MTQQMRTCVRCKRLVFRESRFHFWRHGVEHGEGVRTHCPAGALHWVERP